MKMIQKLIWVDELLWKKLKVDCLKKEIKIKDIPNILIKEHLK